MGRSASIIKQDSIGKGHRPELNEISFIYYQARINRKGFCNSCYHKWLDESGGILKGVILNHNKNG